MDRDQISALIAYLGKLLSEKIIVLGATEAIIIQVSA